MTDRTEAPDDVDRGLVERFQNGDRQAFVELMQRHERRVYNVAYRMLGRVEEARDVTQDAFLSCYRNLDRFRGDSAFTTWLHRIAVNACYDLMRKRVPAASLDEQLSEPAPAPDHADQASLAADVQRALLTVPQDYRAVLVLFELHDLSVDQIASTLEIPVGTVKSRLHRGRAALGRALSGGSPESSAPASGHSPGEPSPTSRPSNPAKP
jgi:RNA polymerase sigma-70 factor (ECF subfamily)